MYVIRIESGFSWKLQPLKNRLEILEVTLPIIFVYEETLVNRFLAHLVKNAQHE